MQLALTDEKGKGELTFELDKNLSAHICIYFDKDDPLYNSTKIWLTPREVGFLANLCQTYLKGLGLDNE
jgi:hypothetical protein